jgi:hypothetical protein
LRFPLSGRKRADNYQATVAFFGAVDDRTTVTTKTAITQGVALDEREKRDLSKQDMADILGIEGPHREQILTDFEAGFRPIKGPTLRVYEALNRARWGASELLQVPRWSVVAGGPSGECTVHHNDWPRFVGKAFREALHPQQWRFKKAGMPTYEMDERTGYRQLVIALIDHVPEGLDVEDIYVEGLKQLEQAILGNAHGA